MDGYTARGTGKGAWRRRLAWTAAGGGVLILVHSLLGMGGSAGIPGWQSANAAISATLNAPVSVDGGGSAAANPVAEPTPGPQASLVVQTDPKGVPADPASATVPLPRSDALPAAAARLDLNAATEAELDALPGVGPSKAKAIVSYRSAHRGFRSVEDLLQVKGIGPKLLDKIRPLVTVGEQTQRR